MYLSTVNTTTIRPNDETAAIEEQHIVENVQESFAMHALVLVRSTLVGVCLAHCMLAFVMARMHLFFLKCTVTLFSGNP